MTRVKHYEAEPFDGAATPQPWQPLSAGVPSHCFCRIWASGAGGPHCCKGLRGDRLLLTRRSRLPGTRRTLRSELTKCVYLDDPGDDRADGTALGPAGAENTFALKLNLAMGE